MTEPERPRSESDDRLRDRMRATADAFEPRGPELDTIQGLGGTRRRRRRAGVVIGSLVLMAGVLAPLGLLSRLEDAPARDPAPAATRASRLVFGSLVHDRYVVSTANADGSDIRQLPIPIAVAIDPSWSPDGSRIVFSGSERDNTEPSDLYLVNADGSGLTRLTDDPEIVDWDPEWSPDGRTIAFTRDIDDTSERTIQRIALLDVGTGSIGFLPFDGYQACDPSWSPDGSRIAFTGNVAGLGNIFVMNADGSNIQRLTDSIDRSGDNAPAWSPDGTMIAFDRTNESTYEQNVYVMGADGSNPHRLAPDRAFEAAPAWSPDGSLIVFIGLIEDPGGNERRSDLYTVRPDGTAVTRLTTGAATAYSPNSYAAPSWT